MSGIESTLVPDDSKLPICEQTAEVNARLLTWNINGLRKVAASQGGLKPLLDQFKADIGETRGTQWYGKCPKWESPAASGVLNMLGYIHGTV